MCYFVFSEFASHGKFLHNLNASFIVLIPKMSGVVELKDFHPISLVGGVHKILAYRLKFMLGKIISSSLNAFLRGGQILNSILITNECIDSQMRLNETGMLFKLDIHKTYDHVNWKFLLYLLRRCEFGEKWCM